jgi:NDP-sugar pyrophosphorylase family protein
MPIKRVTVTIKPELLKKIDSMVGKGSIRNRSHAVEHLILKSIRTEIDTVLILAGGDGSDLRPITYEIPKPLIPIHGKPVLEHQINMLKTNGIKHVILSVGYMKEKIKGYFGDGSRFGVVIDYIEEDRPLGTGGSIVLAKNYIKSATAVMNVDTLMSPDIQEMYEFHKREGRVATILLISKDDPRGFGVVKMKGNQITEFVEKPRKSRSNIVNAGFYILEPAILNMLPKRHFMLEDFFNELAKKGQLSGFVHDGDVFDIGSHDEYAKAIKKWRPSIFIN